MSPLTRRAIRSSIAGAAVLLALLLAGVGRLDYWQGWLFWACFSGASCAYTLDLARHDPGALARRMQGGPRHEREPAQKAIMWLLLVSFGALILIPALAARLGWPQVPAAVSVAGDALVALSFAGFAWVTRTNRFAGASIRVEAGQEVISTGPYGLVRHPMYAASLLLLVGAPLGLGSAWGLVALASFLPALAWRILNEEKVLVRDLAGYGDYLAKVRWRLVPGVW